MITEILFTGLTLENSTNIFTFLNFIMMSMLHRRTIRFVEEKHNIGGNFVFFSGITNVYYFAISLMAL